MSVAAVRCSGLVHVYRVAGTDVAALRGIDLELPAGRSLALLGPSGSGKSTLLQIVAGVLKPSAGRVEVFGEDLGTASRRRTDRVRARSLGVLLQGPASNLLLHQTARQNVAFVARDEVGRRAGLDLLAAEGLEQDRRATGALPPSQQQVAAFAVALSSSPALLVADEPTSRLDTAGRERMLDLMLTATARIGAALMVVTHDEAVARRMDRMIHLRDGRISEEVTEHGRYAVIGSDGSIQLPPEVLGDRWRPGGLVEVTRDGERVSLRLAEATDE